MSRNSIPPIGEDNSVKITLATVIVYSALFVLALMVIAEFMK